MDELAVYASEREESIHIQNQNGDVQGKRVLCEEDLLLHFYFILFYSQSNLHSVYEIFIIYVRFELVMRYDQVLLRKVLSSFV